MKRLFPLLLCCLTIVDSCAWLMKTVVFSYAEDVNGWAFMPVASREHGMEILLVQL